MTQPGTPVRPLAAADLARTVRTAWCQPPVVPRRWSVPPRLAPGAFRSDSLHNFTPEDLAAFDYLAIRVIYNLRRPHEREKGTWTAGLLHLELPNRRVFDTDPRTLRDRVDGERWLFEGYRGMLNEGGSVFGRLFSQLAEADRWPPVFHCTGGKDRTGMTAVLLLSCLGVDRDTVLDEYELTASYRVAERVPRSWIASSPAA